MPPSTTEGAPGTHRTLHVGDQNVVSRFVENSPMSATEGSHFSVGLDVLSIVCRRLLLVLRGERDVCRVGVLLLEQLSDLRPCTLCSYWRLTVQRLESSSDRGLFRAYLCTTPSEARFRIYQH